jgi:hypothetical protein
MKEVCGEEESVVVDRGGEEGERGGRREKGRERAERERKAEVR